LKTQNTSSKWFNNVNTEWLVNGNALKITISDVKPPPVNNGDALLDLATANQYHQTDFYDIQPLLYQTGETTVILVSMNGGIWTLCISLTGNFINTNYNTRTNTFKVLKQTWNETKDRTEWHHLMVLMEFYTILFIYYFLTRFPNICF